MKMTKPLWIRNVANIQKELYRIAKMFGALAENTVDERLRSQTFQMETRCRNLGMRYMALRDNDALYPGE